MSELIGGWYPFVILLVAGFLPNEVWRLLGLVIGAHGPIFDSFLVLGIILLIGGLAAMTLMYETKGKTLEQITAHLAS